jgi:RecA/RadA recombinase
VAKKKQDIITKQKTLLSNLENKYGHRSGSPYEDFGYTRLSTGILSLDYVYGGGIPPGRWVTLYGPESSGKSTLLYFILKSILQLKVPHVFLFDYENSVEPIYFGNIVGNPDKVLGKRGPDGEWVVEPLVRYYNLDTGEAFFRMMSQFLDTLPNIVEYKGSRYMQFSKEQAKTFSVPESDVKIKRDSSIYVKDTGPPIKVVMLIDSYPEMVPEAFLKDPDKDPSAAQARMFSRYIPLLKPRLLSKGAILIGVNHIRLNPRVLYGSPEYDPCGEHLKLASDIRSRVSAVAIPHGKGRIEEELGLDGRIERFQYSKIMMKKNKTFPKGKETILRICFESQGVSGYGIDPLWDTFEYLRTTNQLKKRGNQITISESLPGPWNDVSMTWEDLKLLIWKPLDKRNIQKFVKSQYISEILKGNKRQWKNKLKKVLNIRALCFTQIKDRSAYAMSVETKEEKS